MYRDGVRGCWAAVIVTSQVAVKDGEGDKVYKICPEAMGGRSNWQTGWGLQGRWKTDQDWGPGSGVLTWEPSPAWQLAWGLGTRSCRSLPEKGLDVLGREEASLGVITRSPEKRLFKKRAQSEDVNVAK